MTMETSSSNEHITKSEVKVSGSCLFNTILPPEEGLYGFYVFISPGGQYFSASDKRFAVGTDIFDFFLLGNHWLSVHVCISHLQKGDNSLIHTKGHSLIQVFCRILLFIQNDPHHQPYGVAHSPTC